MATANETVKKVLEDLRKNGGGSHKVIEEWHSESGGQWWRKWSDGYLEQGGLWNEAGPAEGYTDRTITLPVSFGTVNYVVVVQSGFRDNSGLGTYVSEKDTSFFKAKSASNPPNAATWYACGY